MMTWDIADTHIGLLFVPVTQDFYLATNITIDINLSVRKYFLFDWTLIKVFESTLQTCTDNGVTDMNILGV